MCCQQHALGVSLSFLLCLSVCLSVSLSVSPALNEAVKQNVISSHLVSSQIVRTTLPSQLDLISNALYTYMELREPSKTTLWIWSIDIYTDSILSLKLKVKKIPDTMQQVPSAVEWMHAIPIYLAATCMPCDESLFCFESVAKKMGAVRIYVYSKYIYILQCRTKTVRRSRRSESDNMISEYI